MYKVLERLMKEHGETAADLSRATGISEALISMWKKRSGGGISLPNALKIAEHYQIPITELMKGEQ